MDFANLNQTELNAFSVVASKEQVSSELDGEDVILNLKTGVYYGLDAVGSHIWSLIQEPKTINEILQILLEEYEVEVDRCQQDLLALLQNLTDAELIEVKHEVVA